MKIKKYVFFNKKKYMEKQRSNYANSIYFLTTILIFIYLKYLNKYNEINDDIYLTCNERDSTTFPKNPSLVTSLLKIPKMSSANYQHHFSDSDSGSGSDPDQSNPESHHGHRHCHTDFSNSIFKSYFEHTTNQSPSSTSPPTPHDLSKIQSFLNSSSSGALSCLICLERIKPSDPTWSCTSLCYDVFHLLCIQSWARQASDLSAYRAATRLPISPDKAAETSTWNCPKCRSVYTKSQIPKTYFCFCGKVENPPNDNPWILPHSCGEVCDRPLKNSCGHYCLLLCHPGPCASCPKLVKAKCFCGKIEDAKRCGFKLFSCNNLCGKLLDCGTHKCKERCHDGDCPPCQARGLYGCYCGRKKEEKKCCERGFQCENPCERLLGCGKHVCERGCHSGECGQCPLQGKRTCPCGKNVYEGMACDVAVPLCGGTCDKMLSCGLHRCHERCHRGGCIETCRLVVMKSCRCGGLKKEVNNQFRLLLMIALLNFINLQCGIMFIIGKLQWRYPRESRCVKD